MKGKAIAIVLIIVALGVTAWWMRSRPVDVKFATAGMDFARLEHELPLSTAERRVPHTRTTGELLARGHRSDLRSPDGGTNPRRRVRRRSVLSARNGRRDQAGRDHRRPSTSTSRKPRRAQDGEPWTPALERKSLLSGPAAPAQSHRRPRDSGADYRREHRRHREADRQRTRHVPAVSGEVVLRSKPARRPA